MARGDRGYRECQIFKTELIELAYACDFIVAYGKGSGWKLVAHLIDVEIFVCKSSSRVVQGYTPKFERLKNLRKTRVLNHGYKSPTNRFHPTDNYLFM